MTVPVEDVRLKSDDALPKSSSLDARPVCSVTSSLGFLKKNCDSNDGSFIVCDISQPPLSWEDEDCVLPAALTMFEAELRVAPTVVGADLVLQRPPPSSRAWDPASADILEENPDPP
jgi:hypothetical protein